MSVTRIYRVKMLSLEMVIITVQNKQKQYRTVVKLESLSQRLQTVLVLTMGRRRPMKALR